MSQVTITLNGKNVTVPRAVAESQALKAKAAIAAMQPIREQACNRHASEADLAVAQAEQDARRAQYQALIDSCRAALGV